MDDAGFPINLVDALAIGLTLLSGVFALFRGFTREALQVGGWVVAFTITALLLPYARPLALEMTGSSVAATPAAAGALFVGTLIICSLITSQISGAVRKSPLSMLDRSLGFGFGLARGVLLVCLAYIGMLLISDPKDVEKTVSHAKTGQLIAMGADGLLSLLPEKTMVALEIKDDVDHVRPDRDSAPPRLDIVETTNAKHGKTQVSQKNTDEKTADTAKEIPSSAGYRDNDRQTIDSLIEESAKSE